MQNSSMQHVSFVTPATHLKMRKANYSHAHLPTG